MIRKKQSQNGPIIIDLTGPDGNAFVLIGIATKFCRELGWDKAKAQDLINEMIDGDYEHLLGAFDREFGDFVILER